MANADRPRQIKLFLSASEQARVRIAGALQGQNMSAFCRQAVLAEVDRLTEGLALPFAKAAENREQGRAGRGDRAHDV